MPKASIGNWGNNLAVRLPAEISEATHLRAGDRVEIEARGDEVVIRRLTPRRPDIEALFAGQDPDESRARYAGAFQWDEDRGREIVE